MILQMSSAAVAAVEQSFRVYGALGFTVAALLISWPFGRHGLLAGSVHRWLWRSAAWGMALFAYHVAVFFWLGGVAAWGRAIAEASVMLLTFGFHQPAQPSSTPMPPDVSWLLWIGPPLLAGAARAWLYYRSSSEQARHPAAAA